MNFLKVSGMRPEGFNDSRIKLGSATGHNDLAAKLED